VIRLDIRVFLSVSNTPARVTPRSRLLLALGAVLFSASAAHAQLDASPILQWHRMELSFNGPTLSESGTNPNPFLDYRLQCRFTSPTNRTFDVPGFFDTDGQGGTSGSVWKCRFAPDELGNWTYNVTFRSGTEIALSLDPNAGAPNTFDGGHGTFVVTASDKTGRDFRAPGHGRLVNTGAHYLRFAGSGESVGEGRAGHPGELSRLLGLRQHAERAPLVHPARRGLGRRATLTGTPVPAAESSARSTTSRTPERTASTSFP
jgi:hypothetical protein